jgi:hypothetical protein
MCTFKKQFKHLKKTDPIAYYDLKEDLKGSDTISVEILLVIGILGIWVFTLLLT